jgi:NarL family two-component system sensor histidine kinase LiaS
MIKKFTSIRFTYILSHLNAVFITTVLMLALLLSIHALFEPDWLYVKTIFIFILFYLIFGIIVSFYAGFKSSSRMKERIDYLSLLITQYANGNYQSRIHINDGDEITRIGTELNELGEKLQNQVKSLQRMADEKAELAKTAHKAAAIEERQRLARDLHDSVSQQLFALTMMSEAAFNQIDTDPSVAKEHLEEVIYAGSTAQTEMRALLLHLRPVYLSGDSLPKGIHKLIEELKHKSQIDFNIFIKDDLVLSEATEEHVFRIIQEALANILRHAEATEVKIDISKRSTELFIHIRDNGKGFEVNHHDDKKASYGLKTMQERSEELGGNFAVRSNIDQGTYIDIRIPC